MKPLRRPKRWQLDMFMVLMIILMLLVMRAHLSPSWERAAEIGWSALAILGMGMWAYDNRDS